MKKACFFAGLRENYKYLVSHLKDQEDINPVFMLKEIQECDDSQYLASTSNPPKGSSDSTPKSVGYYDKKNYDRMVMQATKPARRTSRMNQTNISPNHCRKSRVSERMMMCSKISLTMSELR